MNAAMRPGSCIRRPTAGDPQEDRAPVLFGNAAPAVLADALPPAAQRQFLHQYAGRKPSIL
jgi:all-trans-retinol 13,14-reductase